jgi:hypothetical protein
MMREVCFLVGRDERVLWTDVGASTTALPDSRPRWRAIWRLRHVLTEIAHSHPCGPLAFSDEDETTMAAVAQALGRTPRFSVVAPDGMLSRVAGLNVHVFAEPGWAETLRLVSGMKEGAR